MKLRGVRAFALGASFGVVACGSRAVPPSDPPAPSARASVSASASASVGCPDGMTAIAAATLSMGATGSDNDDDEKPVHPVKVSAFCIDRTEVTVAAYSTCVRSGRCAAAPTTVDWPKISEAERKMWSAFCNGDRADRQTHPINCVDWAAADAYCRAAGKRLPTEEEWELAARGAESRSYPWGEATPGPRLMNGCGIECVAAGKALGETWSGMYDGDDGWASTAPVGSFPAGATPQGVLDLGGNVWEWTSSWHCSYADAKSCNDERVNRGAGWFNDFPLDARGANRNDDPPGYRNRDLGFRCVR